MLFCDGRIYVNLLIYFWTSFYRPISLIIFEIEQSKRKTMCMPHDESVTKCQTLPLNVNRSRVTNDCAVELLDPGRVRNSSWECTYYNRVTKS